jgi:hypothetical protein
LGERFGERVDTIDNDPTSLPYIEFPKVLHPPLVPLIPVKGNTPRSRALHPSQIDNPSATPQASCVLRLASSVPLFASRAAESR